jgi:hypothetical protein
MSRDVPSSQLHAPFGHGAEVVALPVGVRLNFAPGCVVAKVEDAEMVDRFLDAVAGSDEKNACGFGVRSVRSIEYGRSHVHGGF